MRIDVITLFPELVMSLMQQGITGRASSRGLMQMQAWNPRDFTHDRHRTVDDRPYGGGPGMLMKVQPLQDALQAAKAADKRPTKVYYLSPQGRTLDNNRVLELAQSERMIMVAGRYEGIDERLIGHEIDEEISIGDYVLSGGELAAMVVVDAVTRMLPGALGDEDSAQQDSFSNGLLDCPHYTRPESIDGRIVPSVLLGGDHQAIKAWRLKQSVGRTWLRRPDLLETVELTDEEARLLVEFQKEHRTSQNRD